MKKYLIALLVVMLALAFTNAIRAEETATQQKETTAISQEQATTGAAVSPTPTAMSTEKPSTVSPEPTATSTEKPSAITEQELNEPKETVMPEEENSIKELSGEVSSVDVANSTLTIKYLKDETTKTLGEVTVTADENTLIEKDGLNSSLSDLLSGEKVNIEYVATKDGKNIASSVEIETQK